jgi:fructoselysine-6-P-deglycase FrlB-like protein
MDTIEACRIAIQKEANVICITNLKEKKSDSLVELCENYKKGFVIKTHTKIYPETPLPSTGTFQTALVSLNLLTLLINDAPNTFFDLQINHIPKLVDYLSNSKEVKKECMEVANKLKVFDNFYTVGDGPRYGIARKHAKIMLMEGVKTNACDVESEEFVHSLIESLETKKRNPLILLKPLGTWAGSKMNYEIIRKMWLKHAGKGKLFEIDPFRFLDTEIKLFGGIEGDLLSPFLYSVLSEWQSFYLALAKNVDPGSAKLVKKIRGKEEIKKVLY